MFKVMDTNTTADYYFPGSESLEPGDHLTVILVEDVYPDAPEREMNFGRGFHVRIDEVKWPWAMRGTVLAAVDMDNHTRGAWNPRSSTELFFQDGRWNVLIGNVPRAVILSKS